MVNDAAIIAKAALCSSSHVPLEARYAGRSANSVRVVHYANFADSRALNSRSSLWRKQNFRDAIQRIRAETLRVVYRSEERRVGKEC